jgi:hypothetical protein
MEGLLIDEPLRRQYYISSGNRLRDSPSVGREAQKLSEEQGILVPAEAIALKEIPAC